MQLRRVRHGLHQRIQRLQGAQLPHLEALLQVCSCLPCAQNAFDLRACHLVAGHQKPLGLGAGARRLLRRLSSRSCSRSVCCHPGQRHRCACLIDFITDALPLVHYIPPAPSTGDSFLPCTLWHCLLYHITHRESITCPDCHPEETQRAGGSIRQPAHFCGVVGLKPTYGRVSRYGLIAYGSSLDCVGPLAGCVEDAALLLQTVAGKCCYLAPL